MAVWSGDDVIQDEEGFCISSDGVTRRSSLGVSGQPTGGRGGGVQTGLVLEAVALGLEDEALGHRVVLVVTPCDPAGFEPAAVTARLRQVLPGYMVPAEVIVRSGVPRSPNGKLDRAFLRHELTAARPLHTDEEKAYD